MSKAYALGLLLGLYKRAADEADEEVLEEALKGLESVSLEDVSSSKLPREPKHVPKFIKAPRRITERKKRRLVRQRMIPKPLVSA